MAWIKIQCSVRTNRKFIKAGPAPSWLWLCGVAYCQESLTNGFISAETLPFLGVKNAGQLASHLVAAGLWDVADGGWQVHDYFDHNRSADQIEELRAKRASGGGLGGRPNKPSRNLQGLACETFPVTVSAGVADLVLDPKKKETAKDGQPAPPFDVWWQVLCVTYPAHRVTRNYRTQQAFVSQLTTFPAGAVPGWVLLQANLEANIDSHEWRVKGMVPSLEKYLAEGRWQNVLPPAPPAAEQVSPRTARMLGAV